VTDTGIGLNKEDLERIFKPFEQVESSYTRKYAGTGLGLSLTRQMVELHGGHIWADSQGVGLGSSFYVVIPLEPARNI
jgi:signal transduction histidine kinase